MPRWVLPIILVTGCAFSVQGPSPDRPRNQIPKCDTGKGLVALDGVMAATAGVVALSLVANDLDAAALLPLGVGALYVAGAIHGSRAADACRAEIDNFEMSLASRDPMRVNDTTDEQPRPRPAFVDAPPQPPIPVVQPPPQQPLPSPPQQAPQAAPQPAPAKPVAKPVPKSTPGDDWSDFWREVE
jgi:hypothetical protein